eukprot:TRINITY_DN5809_c0_g1_i2.p1 TRINITY_DN5809_c0_g1~~TRINITY_DN5809_c0_g1_i2.p1  ORF type:complete len:198 (+),score=-10.23 TRINITY_DN5809_c0_g1_i2:426-1019(+)
MHRFQQALCKIAKINTTKKEQNCYSKMVKYIQLQTKKQPEKSTVQFNNVNHANLANKEIKFYIQCYIRTGKQRILPNSIIKRTQSLINFSNNSIITWYKVIIIGFFSAIKFWHKKCTFLSSKVIILLFQIKLSLGIISFIFYFMIQQVLVFQRSIFWVFEKFLLKQNITDTKILYLRLLNDSIVTSKQQIKLRQSST